MNKESFVLFESVFKQFDTLERRLGKDVSNDFIRAIMEYGLYGVMPDEDSDVMLYGFEQSITSIEAAKSRRQKQIEDGSKGGRPRKDIDMDAIDMYLQAGTTIKAIAGLLKVSEDTIQRRKKELEAAKLQNLNVNVSVNDTVSVNDSDTVSVTEEC